jgi:hypothetical protein
MMTAGAEIPSVVTPLTVAMQQETPLPLQSIPADYLERPLFGRALPQQQNVPAGPVRQLGDAIPEESTLEMDEDGFAAVKPKGRRRG